MEETFFKIAITGLMTIAMFILRDFKTAMREMQKSVQDLNIHIASLLEKDVNKERRLSKVEDKVDELEKKS